MEVTNYIDDDRTEGPEAIRTRSEIHLFYYPRECVAHFSPVGVQLVNLDLVTACLPHTVGRTSAVGWYTYDARRSRYKRVQRSRPTRACILARRPDHEKKGFRFSSKYCFFFFLHAWFVFGYTNNIIDTTDVGYPQGRFVYRIAISIKVGQSTNFRAIPSLVFRIGHITAKNNIFKSQC